MKEDFKTFMSQLRETNQTLDFFCDFDKISQNVEDIRLSLCMLNSLLGSSNLRRSVQAIWRRDPSAFQVMDILIAVRSNGKKLVLNSDGDCVVLDTLFESVDGVMEFLNNTGLAELFVEQKVNDLVDYVFGIETGLDTNARKNRSGHVMEHFVADIFDECGVRYDQEVYSSDWDRLQAVLGNDVKRFDFIVYEGCKKYLIEVNFYSGGGSKLNEVARSYTELAPKINSVKDFEFVWITDGVGWRQAKTKLREAYNNIPHVYNLTTIYDFIRSIKG